MSKQSSIDWLVEQLKPAITLQEKHINEFLQRAKAMHKEEIITTYVQGWTERFSPTGTAKNYYTKTFGEQDNE